LARCQDNHAVAKNPKQTKNKQTKQTKNKRRSPKTNEINQNKPRLRRRLLSKSSSFCLILDTTIETVLSDFRHNCQHHRFCFQIYPSKNRFSAHSFQRGDDLEGFID